MTRRGDRRAISAFLGIVVVGVFALVFPFRLMNASAQNINPCGTLWTDNAADAGTPQTDQLDIVAGNMSDNGTNLTTTLTIKNLNETMPAGATATGWFFAWAFNGVAYFSSAVVTTSSTTFNYGTYDPAAQTFTNTGSAVSGHLNNGSNGTVVVTIPLSGVGSPVAGDAFSSSGIFGETATSTSAGVGVVFTLNTTYDKDPSTYDYQLGQSCGGPTPPPTPTPTTTMTPTSSGSTCVPGSPEQNVAENGFICPIEIAGSTGLGEPSLVHDDGAGNGGVSRLFVAAPQSIGNVNSSGGSPLFTSLDGGLHWSAPVRSQFCTGAGGGDSDIAVDPHDNVYTTDLWLGNSCVSVSTDHGQNFQAGSPFGQELQPGDDRPWLAYDGAANAASGGEVFGAYDGVNALHITNTAPLGPDPRVGVQSIQDNIVIPESLVSPAPAGTRGCVCPPGGMAVDNNPTSAHYGRIYVAYSDQAGMAISYADPNAAGTTPQTSWSQSLVPNTSPTGSPFDVEWNFAPIKVDPSNGTVYVTWAQSGIGGSSGYGNDPSNNTIATGGVLIKYAYSTNGGATWSQPILVSTTTATNVFPTMDVAAPGVIDIAYYGAPGLVGDPNEPGLAANKTPVANPKWNVFYTRISDASSTPSATIPPEIAILDSHNGCIQSGGFTGTNTASCADRSLLDFFTLVDDPLQPFIIYDDGDAATGVNLWFTKLATSPGPATPEAPWAALLLAPGVAAVMVALRFRRRDLRRKQSAETIAD